MNKTRVTMMTAAALLGAAPAAQAFCGFYVNSGGAGVFNDAAQVVLMRAGALGSCGCYVAPPLAVALQIVGSHIIRLMQQSPSATPQIDALEKRLDVVHAAYNGQEEMGQTPAPEIGSLLNRLEGLVEQARQL